MIGPIGGYGHNLAGRANVEWRGPELCHDCRQPIDYPSGKWMSVPIEPGGGTGHPAKVITVCRACWRKHHRPKPAPARAGVLGRLAAALRAECRRMVGQEFSARITKPWVPDSRGRGEIGRGVEDGD